jgi:hypothetical protein
MWEFSMEIYRWILLFKLNECSDTVYEMIKHSRNSNELVEIHKQIDQLEIVNGNSKIIYKYSWYHRKDI